MRFPPSLPPPSDRAFGSMGGSAGHGAMAPMGRASARAGRRIAAARVADPVAHRLAALAVGEDGPHRPLPRFGLPQHHGPHAQIGDGHRPTSLRALHSGWACLTRTLADGRRQIQQLLLPGDLIIQHGDLAAGTHLVAITPVTVVQAGRLDPDIWSHPVIQRSLAATQEQLLNHIVRLGRQHAYERFAHLLLELRDRLLLAGVGEERRFEMPLTQELLADVLGLTSVHINRTLQLMRHEGMIVLGGRVVELPDPAALVRIADYRRAAW